MKSASKGMNHDINEMIDFKIYDMKGKVIVFLFLIFPVVLDLCVQIVEHL